MAISDTTVVKRNSSLFWQVNIRLFTRWYILDYSFHCFRLTYRLPKFTDINTVRTKHYLTVGFDLIGSFTY